MWTSLSNNLFLLSIFNMCTKLPSWNGRGVFLHDQSGFLKQMEDLLDSKSHFLAEAGARSIANRLVCYLSFHFLQYLLTSLKSTSLSHYHIAKDPEAFDFIQKCFALLEKLQAVPGVPTIPSYAAHEQFIAEVIATRNKNEERLRSKAKPTKRITVSILLTSLKTSLCHSFRSPMHSSNPTMTWRSSLILLSVPKYVL